MEVYAFESLAFSTAIDGQDRWRDQIGPGRAGVLPSLQMIQCGQAQRQMNAATETKAMLTDHDHDVLLRCCRLGHEVAFGYCRQETGGRPCRLILDCWWERFDVRAFLQAHLPEEVMAAVETASTSPPPSKLMSLVDLMEQTKARLAAESAYSEDPPKRQT